MCMGFCCCVLSLFDIPLERCVPKVQGYVLHRSYAYNAIVETTNKISELTLNTSYTYRNIVTDEYGKITLLKELRLP